MAMFGFSSCNKDCGHEFIEVDYSNDIVGTWTIIEPDHSAAYVFNADGTVSTTGVDGEGYWEDVNGTYSVVNNKITMAFESGHNIEGSFDLIPGQTFSFVDKTGRHTYSYCKEDLADEIVGMWVCDQGDNHIAITTYSEDGKMTMTAQSYEHLSTDLVQIVSDYKVVGDILIYSQPKDKLSEGVSPYTTMKLSYTPNGTAYGDIMGQKIMGIRDGKEMVITSSWLRVKSNLELAGNKYDYIKTFVSNVKGLDKDINFMGFEFNFAKMDGVKLDKMLKALLFNVEFPNVNTIKYACHYNNEPMSMEAPIVVDGNKMTVKMSTKKAAYRDVDLYTFQDQDNSQMHMYMHSTAFVNFFGNMQVTIMEQMGQLDLNDAAAVKAVFDSIDEAVETINVSFVMTKARK